MPPPLVRNPYTTNTPPNGWQALEFYMDAGQWISMSQSGQKWRISSTLTDPLTNDYTGNVRFLGSSNYFSGNVRIDGTLRLGGDLIGTNVVPLVALQASGTRDGTTYLRGDGVWASIPEGGSTEYITTLDPTKIIVQTNDTLYSIGVGPQVAITTNVITWTAPQTFQQGAHTLGDLTGEQGGTVRWRISAGGVFTGNGSGLTNLNATELRTGTIDVARLPSSVALTNRSHRFWGSQTNYGDWMIFGRTTVTGDVASAGTFYGSGAGLTNLDASALASGTVPAGRLPAELAWTNRPQTFFGNLEVRTNITTTNLIVRSTATVDALRFTTNTVRIGSDVLPATGTANYFSGVFIGGHAGPLAGNAEHAVAIGWRAGQNATNSIYRSVIIGYNAGEFATNAPYALIAGFRAGRYGANLTESVALGQQAAFDTPYSPYSVIVGSLAGRYAANSPFATMLGYAAGDYAASGTNMVAIGAASGRNATNSGWSVFIGDGAGLNFEDSPYNIVIGGIRSDATSRVDRLMIHSRDTTIPLLYGEFDNRLLRVHGWLDVTNKVAASLFEGNAAGLTNLPVSGISASGTRDASTFLRGDGTWQPAKDYVATASPGNISISTNATQTVFTLNTGTNVPLLNARNVFTGTNEFTHMRIGDTVIAGNNWFTPPGSDVRWVFDDAAFRFSGGLGEWGATFEGSIAFYGPVNLEGAGTYLGLAWASNLIANIVNASTITALDATFTNIIRAGIYSVVNVKDYGAKGDGVTDDWPVLMSLLASTNPAANPLGQYRIIYFPAGNYVISSNLIWPPGSILLGQGASENTALKRGTSIRPATNWSGTALIDSFSWHRGEWHHCAAIRDIALDGRIIGQSTPVVDYGIRIFQAGEICTIENVKLRSFLKSAIWAAGTHAALNIDRVSIHNVGDYAIALTTGSDWNLPYGQGTNWSGAGTVLIDKLSADRAGIAIIGLNANHFVTVTSPKIEQISASTNYPDLWPWQAGRWIVRYTTNSIYGAPSSSSHNALVTWIGGHVNHDHNNQGLQTTNAAFFTSDHWRPRFMLSGTRVYGAWSGTNYLWVWTPERQYPRVDWDEAPVVWHQITNYHGTFVASRYFGDAAGLTNLPVSGIAASGTRDGTTFLRGDGTWAQPSSGGLSNPPMPGLTVASHDTNQWAWYRTAVAPGSEIISMWAQAPNSGTSPAASPGANFSQDGAVAFTTTNSSGQQVAGNLLLRTNASGVTTRIRYSGNIVPAVRAMALVYHVLAVDHPADLNVYAGWISGNAGGQTDWPQTAQTYAIFYSTNGVWHAFVRKSSSEAVNVPIGLNVEAGRAYRLSINRNADGSLDFFINNRLVATVDASNAPPDDHAAAPVIWVRTKSATTLDWRWYKSQVDYMPDPWP